MEIENLDENAAWHKVFTSGSEALKSKLKKVHAKNPKFQAFLRSIGHEGEQKSVAKAKQDVADINKKKAREAAIAAAARKSPKNKEMIDLRVKQHNLAKAFGPAGDTSSNQGMVNYVRSGGTFKAGRLGEEVEDAAKKKRMFNLKLKLIKVAANKGKSKEGPPAHSAMPSKYSRSQASGYAADLKRDLQSKYTKEFAESHEPMKPYVKAGQEKFDAQRRAQDAEERAKKRQAGTSYGLYLAAAKKAKLKEGRMKDIATDREETSRLKAQEVLGGPVVAKSTLPAGKRPAGQRRARSLARVALKNLLSQRKGK